VFWALARGRDRAAFLGSAGFLAGLSVATAACVYPVMLFSSGDPSLSMTAGNDAAEAGGLRTAFAWMLLALPPAVLYFVIVWCRGKGLGGGRQLLNFLSGYGPPDKCARDACREHSQRRT
jgi:cytochrome d ubiquinol oxidase subunit II